MLLTLVVFLGVTSAGRRNFVTVLVDHAKVRERLA